jgi:hypothetical protein
LTAATGVGAVVSPFGKEVRVDLWKVELWLEEFKYDQVGDGAPND